MLQESCNSPPEQNKTARLKQGKRRADRILCKSDNISKITNKRYRFKASRPKYIYVTVTESEFISSICNIFVPSPVNHETFGGGV